MITKDYETKIEDLITDNSWGLKKRERGKQATRKKKVMGKLSLQLNSKQEDWTAEIMNELSKFIVFTNINHM